MCNYMQQRYKITQPFLEMLVLRYFQKHWACPGKADHTQQMLHDLTKASLDI